MPTSNKRGPFKNNSAKLLAQLNQIDPSDFFDSRKLITVDDVQYLIDISNYVKYGVALYSNKNVPKEKRYDTDWEPYTKSEFCRYYGINFKEHWDNAIIYRPIYDTSLPEI